MNEIEKKIGEIGIVPVVVLDDAKKALPLGKALCEGGLPCAEVTFRTAAAEESIRILTENYPEMLVGAGTVLTTEQVDRAVKAGAKFIVSPGLNPKIVSYCLEKGVPMMPGCSTPSDIEKALELGLDVVKFFPAEASGGLSMIKALSAPYPNLKFMPTGGINAKNMTEYLSNPKILACGGSWMVKKDLIESDNFEEIKRLTKEAVMMMLGFEIRHVGINCENNEAANEVAATFDDMFGMTKKSGHSSVFAGTGIEVMKSMFRGSNGHIAVGTNNVARAMNFLGQKGIEFDLSSASYDGDRIKAVYMAQEIGGFAVHLLAK